MYHDFQTMKLKPNAQFSKEKIVAIVNMIHNISFHKSIKLNGEI